MDWGVPNQQCILDLWEHYHHVDFPDVPSRQPERDLISHIGSMQQCLSFLDSQLNVVMPVEFLVNFNSEQTGASQAFYDCACSFTYEIWAWGVSTTSKLNAFELSGFCW